MGTKTRMSSVGCSGVTTTLAVCSVPRSQSTVTKFRRPTGLHVLTTSRSAGRIR
ncbi:hypothetical protein HanHA300_Chr08g0274281 [Helianthus annuus]|nr:hypothetical protein HanHA300_Chr08g0274281 [Helianthus annuus]KAJ0553013.1 hypothetical protein HanHA89_Chr08g0291611 [Helianthus annuus]